MPEAQNKTFRRRATPTCPKDDLDGEHAVVDNGANGIRIVIRAIGAAAQHKGAVFQRQKSEAIPACPETTNPASGRVRR